LPIWADFMRVAAALEEPGEFTVPPTVAFRHVCGNPTQDAFLPSTELAEPCGPVAHPVASIWVPGDRPPMPPAPGER
jgi:hypothetical protein